MSSPRTLYFLGRSYQDLLALSPDARQSIGRELNLVQRGSQPTDWKPMTTIGPGVNEIRVRRITGAYRVIYVAKFEEAVYVLHCFEKKSQRTSRSDVEIATTRYKFNDHSPGLYKTTDYGATWTKITNGLPANAFTRVVREDDVRRDLLVAGTELGLFISWNGGRDWSPFQLNLPITPITA